MSKSLCFNCQTPVEENPNKLDAKSTKKDWEFYRHVGGEIWCDDLNHSSGVANPDMMMFHYPVDGDKLKDDSGKIAEYVEHDYDDKGHWVNK